MAAQRPCRTKTQFSSDCQRLVDCKNFNIGTNAIVCLRTLDILLLIFQAKMESYLKLSSTKNERSTSISTANSMTVSYCSDTFLFMHACNVYNTANDRVVLNMQSRAEDSDCIILWCTCNSIKIVLWRPKLKTKKRKTSSSKRILGNLYSLFTDNF